LHVPVKGTAAAAAASYCGAARPTLLCTVSMEWITKEEKALAFIHCGKHKQLRCN
jgi:hypothetical protein